MQERWIKIPDRWIGCPPYGELINSIFMPMKTMLDKNANLPEEFEFTPDQMVAQMREKKIDIGLVINLTPCQHRYDEKVFSSYGILYRQIACRGNSVPDDPQVREFRDVCDQFLRSCPNKVIAVHCTHGCNRTGFMICSYLNGRRNWQIHEAIIHFAAKRPPGIYKQHFINCLMNTYGSWRFKGPIPTAAPKPDWTTCYEPHLRFKNHTEEMLVGEVVENNSRNSSSSWLNCNSSLERAQS